MNILDIYSLTSIIEQVFLIVTVLVGIMYITVGILKGKHLRNIIFDCLKVSVICLILQLIFIFV